MTKVTNYDVAEYLDNDAMIAEYLTAALEENDVEFFFSALDDVIRAKGISDIAKQTGLRRESLYKTFKPGAHPQYETVVKITHALGLKAAFLPD